VLGDGLGSDLDLLTIDHTAIAPVARLIVLRRGLLQLDSAVHLIFRLFLGRDFDSEFVVACQGG
jgi:hypothetical protein